MPTVDSSCSSIRSKNSRTISLAQSITQALLMASCNPSFLQTSINFWHRNNMCFVPSGSFKPDGQMEETFMSISKCNTTWKCSVQDTLYEILHFARQDNFQTFHMSHELINQKRVFQLINEKPGKNHDNPLSTHDTSHTSIKYRTKEERRVLGGTHCLSPTWQTSGLPQFDPCL